jgi:hypothetical protein
VFVYEGTPPKPGRPVEDPAPLLKWCRRHGVVPHARYRDGRGLRLRCKRCVGEAVTRRHRKVRAILVAEAGGRCAVCGYRRCMYNLQFHHVDPQTKAFEMNMGRGKSLESFREEAKKCVLVCANCHGEIEAGLIPSPPAGATYGGAAAA